MGTFGAGWARRLLTLGLAVALVGAPTAVQAKAIVHVDPRGDPAIFSEKHVTKVPPDGDIIRTRLAHKDRRIRIRIKFAELRMRATKNEIETRVLTNEGVVRWIRLTTTPKNPSGQVKIYHKDLPTNTWTEGHRCTVHHSIDYVHNVVSISYARACISHPRWVRIDAGAHTTPDNEAIFKDDALRRGLGNTGLPYFQLSRRIHRG